MSERERSGSISFKTENSTQYTKAIIHKSMLLNKTIYYSASLVIELHDIAITVSPWTWTGQGDTHESTRDCLLTASLAF